MSNQVEEAVTVINVFTLLPEKQQEFLQLATEYTDQFVSKAPGFISAAFFVSIDGTKVTSVAQWESPETFQIFSTPADDVAVEASREKGQQIFQNLNSNTYTVAARFFCDVEPAT